jgi:hypothetical protein
MGFLNRSAKLYVAIGRKQTTVKITMKSYTKIAKASPMILFSSVMTMLFWLLANVKPGAHVAAPGFIVESSLEDSKVLVTAMGAQDFSRQQ